MNIFKIRSTIKAKIIAFNTVLVLILAVFSSWYFPSRFIENELKNQVESIESTSHVVAENSITAIEFNDETSLNNLINSIMVIEEVRQVGLYDINNKLISKTNYRFASGIDSSTQMKAVIQNKQSSFLELNDSLFQIAYRIESNKQTYGTIVVIASNSNTISEASSFRNITILIYTLILIVSTVLVGFFSKITIDPIINVTATMTELSEGKGNIHKRISAKSDDEVGDLIREFNKLIDFLNDLVDNLQNRGIQISIFSGELVKNINSFSSAILQQGSATTQTTTTLEELSVSVSTISENAEKVVEIAETTKSSSEQGLNAAEDYLNIISKVRTENNEMAEKLHELGKKSQLISEVLKSVDEINDQTRLISFNAMIEAKGAGNAGKRFMIVATEIKQMSEDLNERSKKIKTILDDISDFIIEVVNANRKIIPVIEKSVASGKNLSERLGEIHKSATDANTNMKQIYLATEQQNKAVSEVVFSMREISKSSELFVEGSGKIQTIADKLNTIAVEFKA